MLELSVVRRKTETERTFQVKETVWVKAPGGTPNHLQKHVHLGMAGVEMP